MISNITQTSLVLLLTLALFCSCSKSDPIIIPSCENCAFTCIDDDQTDVITNACKDNWDCTFNVSDQSQVAISESDGISSGNKLVFQMIAQTEGVLEIADDEFTNILVFEIDEDQSSFSVEGDQVNDIQTLYKTICFCPNVEFVSPNSGCIQGELQTDGTWFVQGNLSFEGLDGTFRVLIDAQFTTK